MNKSKLYLILSVSLLALGSYFLVKPFLKVKKPDPLRDKIVTCSSSKTNLLENFEERRKCLKESLEFESVDSVNTEFRVSVDSDNFKTVSAQVLDDLIIVPRVEKNSLSQCKVAALFFQEFEDKFYLSKEKKGHTIICETPTGKRVVYSSD
tara:strand:- start:9668 stop:10120 length:453 start_codon:yes stop_codon:yes gene_type:complete